MPSETHEDLLARIEAQPALLARMVHRLRRRHLEPTLGSNRGVLRRRKSLAPDLVLTGPTSWAILELQLDKDATKWRRWALMAAVLADELETVGDLFVITRSAAVARWAETASRWRGPCRTEHGLRPVVLLLDEAGARRLLATRDPDLAYVAAWAVRDRANRAAVKVVESALRVCERLPASKKAEAQRAILAGLGEKLTRVLKEFLMRRESQKPTAAYLDFVAAFEARGKAEGKAEGILTVLEARGMKVSPSLRKRVLACTELAQLNRWLRQAAVVTSARELLS